MTKRIALVGNPNVGKSTLFNTLTGLNQNIANYPGVTVEGKSGSMQLGDGIAELIDMPGCYSLSAHSPDEMVVADELLDRIEGDKIDGIIVVVDATNPVRNFYLLSQVLELGKPTVLALNMIDLAEKEKIYYDMKELSHSLNIPAIPISAYNKKGVNELRTALTQILEKETGALSLAYPEHLKNGVQEFCHELNTELASKNKSIHPFEALRVLVDKDGYAQTRILEWTGEKFIDMINRYRESIGKDCSLIQQEAKVRYDWARGVVSKARMDQKVSFHKRKIDDVLCHPVLGLVVFILIMGLAFQAIYTWAGPLMDLIEESVGALGNWVGSYIENPTFHSLVVEGVFAGVGGILVFLPQILILTLFVAILEGSGYMSRAAFLMDRILRACGLSGHSFIPMLSSYACAIPGIMATRTIRSWKDRLATMLVAPLMTCSARLPVYVIMIAIVIPDISYFGGFINLQGIVLLFMYFVGVIYAIPIAFIFKKFFIKGKTSPFLMELPSYKMPHYRTVIRKVYDQGFEFVKRAGTIIFISSIAIWAISTYPKSEEISSKYENLKSQTEASNMKEDELALALEKLDNQEKAEQIDYSIIGRMGHTIEPVVKPLGWDWRIGISVIASFPARELIVSTLGIIFGLGEDEDEESSVLRQTLGNAKNTDNSKLFSLPVGLSVMIFFALCAQCAATLATIKRETKSWKWPIVTFTYMTALAYVSAFFVYHISKAMIS